MPETFMTYKCAIQLNKLYNSNNHSLEGISLHLNQILTTRQTNFIIMKTNFIIMKTNATKFGLNILSNRLSVLNGLIPLSCINVSINTFKVNCKKLLLDKPI